MPGVNRCTSKIGTIRKQNWNIDVPTQLLGSTDERLEIVQMISAFTVS
jgi:hypothetical protein